MDVIAGNSKSSEAVPEGEQQLDMNKDIHLTEERVQKIRCPERPRIIDTSESGLPVKQYQLAKVAVFQI